MGHQQPNNLSSPGFVENIRKAIAIITQMSAQAKDQEILSEFYRSQVTEQDARTILILLPIASSRRLLPEILWPDDYQELNRADGTLIPKKLSEMHSYAVVLEEVDRYFATQPGGENVLKLAGRSSEFHAINELLLRGKDLEGIRLTPMVISW